MSIHGYMQQLFVMFNCLVTVSRILALMKMFTVKTAHFLNLFTQLSLEKMLISKALISFVKYIGLYE